MRIIKPKAMINKQRIIDKINENQESDVKKYEWEDISDSLKSFWNDYFNNNK